MTTLDGGSFTKGGFADYGANWGQASTLTHCLQGSKTAQYPFRGLVSISTHAGGDPAVPDLPHTTLKHPLAPYLKHYTGHDCST